MPDEKEPIKIADTNPNTPRQFPMLVYATIEFEISATDVPAGEAAATEFLDKLVADNHDKFLRVQDAKVADKNTGYFFRK